MSLLSEHILKFNRPKKLILTTNPPSKNKLKATERSQLIPKPERVHSTSSQFSPNYNFLQPVKLQTSSTRDNFPPSLRNFGNGSAGYSALQLSLPP